MRYRFKRAIQPRLDAAETWLRHQKEAVMDIAAYARDRLGYGPTRPSDHAAHALNRIIADAKLQLSDLKKSTAVCIAEHIRMVKVLELDASNIAEWSRRAAKADADGEPQLADWARRAAQDHQRNLERTRVEAEKLERRVDSLKRELRAFNRAIEDARAAANYLRAGQRSREAKAMVEGEMRHAQELAAALTAISTLGEDRTKHDES